MKTAAAFMAAAGAAATLSAGALVEFRECPKCDKRIRIDLAADKAYVNLSRLEGADALAAVFPDDPLKGDFALFGYGVDNARGGGCAYPSRRRSILLR